MAFIKKSEALAANQRELRYSTKSADQLLRESAKSHYEGKKYDIFLSHAREDAEIILGVKVLLEEAGHSVYVDWIEDGHLDRSSVTPATAQLLRTRMCACRSMLFTTSNASCNSKWMPWELGFFDGLRDGQITILPILGDYDTTFKGQEYLGLYPVVEKDGMNRMKVVKSYTEELLLREYVLGSRAFRLYA
jgi:hypothetical protein